MRYKTPIVHIESELQGGTFYKKYVYTTTIDFTGATIKMQVRKSNGDENVVLEFVSTDANTMVVDATLKTIELKQTAAVMQEIREGDYDYDIKIMNTGVFLQKGKFKIKDTTTR